MRNLTPCGMTALEGLEAFGKGLHKKVKQNGIEVPNPSYVIFQDEKDNLKVHYAEYDTKTIPCKLEEVQSHYTDAEKREKLYNMYDRSRQYMVDLWDEVAKDDGVLQMCPLCGKHEVTDWDHYIPRSVMPEYSMHVHNLIPTCTYCNGDKHGNWVENGKRVYFNAYYDVMPDLHDVLDIKIEISQDTKTPMVGVSLKPLSEETPDNIRIVHSTIEKLKLISNYWQYQASSCIEKYVNTCINRVKIGRRHNPDLDMNGFWQMEKEVLEEDIVTLPNVEFIERLVKEEILTSDVFEQWVLGL